MLFPTLSLFIVHNQQTFFMKCTGKITMNLWLKGIVSWDCDGLNLSWLDSAFLYNIFENTVMKDCKSSSCQQINMQKKSTTIKESIGIKIMMSLTVSWNKWRGVQVPNKRVVLVVPAGLPAHGTLTDVLASCVTTPIRWGTPSPPPPR